MSGWDSWAANILASSSGIAGVALYCPASGAIWGKSGAFDCPTGGLNEYDKKAEGKEASCPEINKKKYMFLRKTTDEEAALYKRDSAGLFITKGPSGSKVAVVVKEGEKLETPVAAAVNYLKPHV